MNRKPKPKTLLVEGNDDLHVVANIAKKFDLPLNFDIVDCNGKDGAIQSLLFRLEKQSFDFDTFGLIVDADLDITNQWISIRNLLDKQGFSQVMGFKEIPEEGLILENEDKKVGVWIMPNNKIKGELEDFIRFLIPQDDQLIERAEKIVSEIEKEGLHKYKNNDHSKALIHTWLAWQETPGTPMGASITKRYLTTDEKTCQAFVNWLKLLFSE